MQAKRRLPTLPSEASDDKTSERARKHVQLVHGPYRDASDAKLQRMRDIDAWLEELDEAESLRAARLRERALLAISGRPGPSAFATAANSAAEPGASTKSASAPASA